MGEILVGIFENIMKELRYAEEHFDKFNSAHEGYAVIKEGLDDLREEIKCKRHVNKNMRKEALQVATMAVRFIKDLTLCLTQSDLISNHNINEKENGNDTRNKIRRTRNKSRGFRKSKA